MLGICKTNISELQGSFLIPKNEDYVGFWTRANESKLKGLGVGIVIKKIWEKHIGQINRFRNYYIDVLLLFKRYKLVIINTYIPPSDREEKKKIQQYIIQKIRECEKNKTRVIIMGDFNDIRSKELDQNREDSNRKQSLPLLRWLENSNLVDLYRESHPYSKEFTWSNGTSSTRIDYIWASKILSQCSIKCEIYPAELITGSNHRIVVTKLGTGIIQKVRSTAINKYLKGKKRILKLDKAQKEEQKSYKTKLEEVIMKELRITDKSAKVEKICKDKDLDEI